MEHDDHKDEHGIYCGFYKESWEDADHPMACVTLDNEFLRVNHAFERLLGYSDSELRGRTWMSITRKEHVGGDLASMADVIEGRIDTYRMEKDYQHKRGHYIPAVLTVRRFPRAAHIPILLFRVEAPLATATRFEIEEVQQRMHDAVNSLRDELDSMKGVVVNNRIGDETTIGGNNSGMDRVGGNKSTVVPGLMMFIILVVLMAILILVSYFLSFQDFSLPTPKRSNL